MTEYLNTEMGSFIVQQHCLFLFQKPAQGKRPLTWADLGDLFFLIVGFSVRTCRELIYHLYITHSQERRDRIVIDDRCI